MFFELKLQSLYSSSEDDVLGLAYKCVLILRQSHTTYVTWMVVKEALHWDWENCFMWVDPIFGDVTYTIIQDECLETTFTWAHWIESQHTLTAVHHSQLVVWTGPMSSKQLVKWLLAEVFRWCGRWYHTMHALTYKSLQKSNIGQFLRW